MILIKATGFGNLCLRCNWFLSVLILICPVSSTEVDYIYDIGEQGLLAEGDLFDFENGGLSGRLTSNDAIIAFDIGAPQDGNGPYQRNHPPPQGSTTTQEDYLHGKEIIEDGSFNNSEALEDPFQSKLSWSGDYIFGSLLVCFGFMSLMGNGCILLIFCSRHRRLSPAEVFLVNLGIVDILLAIVSYPLAMIGSFRHRWDFGEIGCTLYAFICYFLGVASIFSVTAIALIRYLKTCSPVKGNRITSLTSCKMIGWGYLVALIWAGLPLLGFGNYGREPFGLSCTLDWAAKDKASRVYLVLVTIFCVFLPLFIIIFSYTQIIMLVKQSDALVRSNGVNKRNTSGSDVQLTWISGLVSLGFIIGWGPYSIVSLWATYRGEIVLPMWATPIPVLMAKSSIAYNPVIYFFFTARYRADFYDLLHGWIFSSRKGGEQVKNNNNNQRRSSRPCSNKTMSEGQDSPESMSLTGRQLTNSSQVTPQQYAMDRNSIFLQYVATPNDIANQNNNNNAEMGNNQVNIVGAHGHDRDNILEEACILFLNGREENDRRQQGHYPPSSHHLIASVNGNGTNPTMTMIKGSSSSSTRKLLAVSPSFISICSGSSCEEEQQV